MFISISVLEQDAEFGNNNNNSLLWPPGQFPVDDTSSLDYLLALSLEDMDGQEGVWTDVWDHQFGRTPVHSSLQSQLSPANNNFCNITPPRTTASHSPSGQLGHLCGSVYVCSVTYLVILVNLSLGEYFSIVSLIVLFFILRDYATL